MRSSAAAISFMDVDTFLKWPSCSASQCLYQRCTQNIQIGSFDKHSQFIITDCVYRVSEKFTSWYDYL